MYILLSKVKQKGRP